MDRYIGQAILYVLKTELIKALLYHTRCIYELKYYSYTLNCQSKLENYSIFGCKYFLGECEMVNLLLI